MKRQVKVVLGPNGSVKIEAENFVGTSCEDATKFIGNIFGVPSKKQYKSEYYQTDNLIEGLPSEYCG